MLFGSFGPVFSTLKVFCKKKKTSTIMNSLFSQLQLLLPQPSLLLVATGGALGSVLRFAIGTWTTKFLSISNLYLSTTTVNVIGSFVLGCLAAVLTDRSKSLYLFLGIGFCGGFTTFSTFSLELLEPLLKGNPLPAIVHCLLNVSLGLLAVSLGYWLFKPS